MSVRMHAREQLVRQARSSLIRVLADWGESDLVELLTEAEYLAIVTSEMSSMLGGALKMMIREERHGNRDTSGGFAPVDED